MNRNSHRRSRQNSGDGRFGGTLKDGGMSSVEFGG